MNRAEHIAVCIQGVWFIQERAASLGCVNVWRTVAGPYPSEAAAEAALTEAS